MERPSSRVEWARWIVGASILSTVIHYTDNYLFIADYPQPDWIDHQVVLVAWIGFTIFGILGFVFLSRGLLTAAGLSFLVYSYTGLSSLAHYKFGALAGFTPKMHLFIWLDGLTGAGVLFLALWCLFGPGRSPAGGPI